MTKSQICSKSPHFHPSKLENFVMVAKFCHDCLPYQTSRTPTLFLLLSLLSSIEVPYLNRPQCKNFSEFHFHFRKLRLNIIFMRLNPKPTPQLHGAEGFCFASLATPVGRVGWAQQNRRVRVFDLTFF